MWLVPTKKELKKELEKISEGFKLRDERINELEKKIISIEQIELLFRKLIIPVKSGVHSELNFEPNSEHYERAVVRNAIKTRPNLLQQTIKELIEKGFTTMQMFRFIVQEKKLISKTQFYHYLSLVRSELKSGVPNKPKITYEIKEK
jgi:prefoldin subunit 5